MWVTENYRLDPVVRSQALHALGQPQHLSVDLFADPMNALEGRFISCQQNAWTFHWGLLSTETPCWANPPFSKLLEVRSSQSGDLHSGLGKVRKGKGMRTLLDKMTLLRVPLPEEEIYWSKEGKSYLDRLGLVWSVSWMEVGFHTKTWTKI